MMTKPSPTPPIGGILLDLDETIHSREQAFWRWISLEATTSRVKFDQHTIGAYDRHGRGDQRRLAAYLDDLFDWGCGVDAALDRKRKGIAANVSMEPDVLTVLERLKRTYHLGLVTNGSSAGQRAKLDQLGVVGLFDPIVSSEEAGASMAPRSREKCLLDIAVL